MESTAWFELKYRDKSFKKYDILIEKPKEESDSYLVQVSIFYNEDFIAQIFIKFSRSWISTRDIESDPIILLNANEPYSPLIMNLIREIIFDTDINDLNGKEYLIHSRSEYSNRIFINENGILNLKRDPVIIAKENRFAREIVLRELYLLQGKYAHRQIIEKCNFYYGTIRRAIRALSDRNFLEIDKGLIRLTYEGQIFVEEEILSVFNNKVFLIAACKNSIYTLIDYVYEPAVNELGYELKFQEKSEPKGAITDDIWDYLENSKLILCDLTFKRPNCFIEYGYAFAKGKHIILCVEESEGKTKDGQMKVPFDTLTQKYSFWRKEWLTKNQNKEELNKFKNEIKDRIKMKLDILDISSKI